MRRAALRFVLLAGSVALLVFLILFQQTLQNGLITSFIGAIEQQSAPVIVYSVDGRRNLQGSVITPPVEEAIAAVDGVAASGRIGVGTFSMRAPDRAEGEVVSTAVVGYEDRGLGAPTSLVEGRLPRADGEAVALDTAGEGFAVGDRLTVLPGDAELTIVGRAGRIGLQASPTVFVTFPTYEAAVRSANPDAAGALPSAIAVSPAEGVTPSELAERINDEVPDADALTRRQATEETPGVQQVRQSFQVIFLLYGLVVPLVTGLFFLIITLQKAGALTLLRAVGAPGSRLVQALLIQVSIVLVAGIGLGVALYAPLSVQQVGDIPLTFQTGAVVGWSIALFVLGLLSALVSARRVLAIDPIRATTGAGVDG
jgi:putative ABC transport system permease protein